MPIKQIEQNINVVDAAKIRIKKAFSRGKTVYMSFSCGKDSLCMSNLVYELILNGEINPKQLCVIFIDEEGIYKSMEEAAFRWRKKFMSVGAEFRWYCLPFKQVSVIDSLSTSESWITFEPGKEDLWIRKPPKFAITYDSDLHYAGEINYQTFCARKTAGGIQLVGTRTSESLTRMYSMAMSKEDTKVHPIHDWLDTDVWLYIKEHSLEFPEIYIRLYEAGVTKKNLRLCAFFGDCGTQGLRWIAETDPELWERIEAREPNAYMVMLYWDSEMFRRQSSKRTELEIQDEEKKDYQLLMRDIIFHPEKYKIGKDTLQHMSSLEWVDRDKLKPNDYNPNKVTEENLKLLQQSILTNGWTLPIVCRPDYTIIDGFHRWTVSGREPLNTILNNKVPVVIVDHGENRDDDIYGTITHNRARGTHLLEPMKKIVKELIDDGKTVPEISKQLGMKPEEIFRLSGFSRDTFLEFMTKDVSGYSNAKIIKKV